ncbi:SAM-dependent methyltransferase [Psychrobacillus sp. NEAU-3TGS]|uniref:SAM-dependent methyltransferase n=1 Tax=Psychrobacillus sp. NEAU-3TGS TaxID=2995412 RepID=UPI0024978549|nr:SAM-dependent methyltransferase [Psychrobacillus sp. NEAU-3TGS]MDI2586379.1 SAM-dependent methyltransferase [Psychrobacillus sp. NEAU-3TGS]
MKEQDHDRLLRIKTEGVREWQHQSAHYNRYEATPYMALEALFDEYVCTTSDKFVDFGCGKGRFPFYIHHHLHVSVTGVEMNGQLYQEALENLTKYMERAKPSRASIRFEHIFAEGYEIESDDNRFYFFNPFSIQIFQKVISNILLSVEQHPRSVDVILYYPTSEYIQFLEEHTAFELLKEVRVPELYQQNNNERFVIFRYE